MLMLEMIISINESASMFGEPVIRTSVRMKVLLFG